MGLRYFQHSLPIADKWKARLEDMREQKLAGYPEWLRLCFEDTSNSSAPTDMAPEAQHMFSSLYK